MNSLTNSVNKNFLTKKIMLSLLAFVTLLGIVSALNPTKAQAYWVNKKPFDYAMLSKYCGTQMYPSGSSVDTWHCLPKNGVTPLPFWLQPGAACRYVYGSTFKFVLTNMSYKYGGYCAQWR